MGKSYDIVSNRDGRWCVADTHNTEQVPRVKMVQFQQNGSAMAQALAYWADMENKERGGSPYANLYMADPTGNVFWLPYLEKYHHEVKQTWSAGAGPGYANHMGIKYRLIAEQYKSTAAGVEQPHAWAGEALSTYTISFPLINTFNTADIAKNWTFLYVLLWSSLLGRPNPIKYVPPCIYTLDIPGVRYSPACTIETVSVQHAGAMSLHKLDGLERTIPDAWIVTLHIKELILESRSILDVAMNQNGMTASAVTAGIL